MEKAAELAVAVEPIIMEALEAAAAAAAEPVGITLVALVRQVQEELLEEPFRKK